MLVWILWFLLAWAVTNIYHTKEVFWVVMAVIYASMIAFEHWLRFVLDEFKCATCSHDPGTHQSVDKEAYPYCMYLGCACLCYKSKTKKGRA